eukprot:8022764-Lingulodinium_polyedra.AAC.1
MPPQLQGSCRTTQGARCLRPDEKSCARTSGTTRHPPAWPDERSALTGSHGPACEAQTRCAAGAAWPRRCFRPTWQTRATDSAAARLVTLSRWGLPSTAREHR